MDKIYKDYEDQYIANNIVYAPTLDSEYKLIHEKKLATVLRRRSLVLGTAS